jgi:hypothetical protein
VRRKLKQFPEIVQAEIDLKRQRGFFQALPTFDAYVALEHGMEDAGGAIHMFHPRYLVPRAYHAALGVKNHDQEKLDRLEARLKALPGVRTAIIDPDRWFTNEKGLDVGGAVVFADPSPPLEFLMIQEARNEGFLLETSDHDAGNSDKEWSEMNHAFAGLCLLALAVCGMLQIGLRRPPWFIKYGTVLVWLALFVFLFICADRTSWPLGPISWWDGFRELDTAQHRIGIGLILVIAIGDFVRLKKGWSVNPALSRWGMLAVGLAGSIMLFTHLHTSLEPAHEKMVARMNAEHMAMAAAALLFSLSKFAWDAWRVPKRGGEYLWLGLLGVLGIILTMYVE